MRHHPVLIRFPQLWIHDLYSKTGKNQPSPRAGDASKTVIFSTDGFVCWWWFFVVGFVFFFLPVSLSSVLKYHFHLAMINDYLGVIEQSSVLR